MKVRLRDIKLLDLDGDMALQVTKYIRTARANEGVVISLRDEEVIWKVFNHGLNTTDVHLRMLFLTLRRSLKTHLARKLQDEECTLPKYANSFFTGEQNNAAVL